MTQNETRKKFHSLHLKDKLRLAVKWNVIHQDDTDVDYDTLDLWFDRAYLRYGLQLIQNNLEDL